MSHYKIAVIEGDGIGREVVPEGLRVLEAAGRRYNATFSWKHFDWSCETYLRTGRMMPEDGLDRLRDEADSRGVDLATLAVAWVLERADGAVCGPNRVDHLDPVLAARGLRLGNDDVDRIGGFFA